MSEVGGGSSSTEGSESGNEYSGASEVSSTSEVSGTSGASSIGEASDSTDAINTTETSGGYEVESAYETTHSIEVDHSMETSNNEITINPQHTTQEMNQILETPETLAQAQISIENYHNQSIEQILDMNGQYIETQDRARIENGADHIQAVEYNPNSNHTGAFRTSNGKSSIEISAMSQSQMERTTKHETNHFASKNREIIVPMPDKNGYMVHQSVGMRHTSWFHNTVTGENSGFETKGRGLNEGMTTMYTNEQLTAISKEKGEAAMREGVYSHATEVSQQLQDIMGKDALGKAYYGGKTMELQEKMDAIGGKGTFEAFQISMDKTISKDYAERVQGMREAQEILAQLNEKKEGGHKA